MQIRPEPDATQTAAEREDIAWNRAIEAAARAARRLATEAGSGEMALGALRASQVIDQLRRSVRTADPFAREHA